MCDLHITTHFHIWYREKSQSGREDKRFVDMFFLVPDEHHKNNINQHIIQNCMFSDWDAQSHEVQLPNHDYNNDKHARSIKGVWTQCIKIDIEVGESASIQDEQKPDWQVVFFFYQKHSFPFTLITWQYVLGLSDQIFTLCEKNLLIKYNHNDVLVSHVVALFFALQLDTAADVDEQFLVLCCNRGSQLWCRKTICLCILFRHFSVV